MLCQECKKKSTCVELCEEAEKWVSQDYVSQRESTKPEWLLELLNVKSKPPQRLIEIQSFFSAEKVNFPFLTSLQNRILHLFYFEGLSYAEIAMRVNRRVYKVDYRIRSAKRRILRFFSDNRKGHLK